MWADGVFMVNPFLAEYGSEFGDSQYTEKETVDQLVIYASHLQRSTGLLRHAYDEAREQTWADDTTGQSPEVWCRAEGWFHHLPRSRTRVRRSVVPGSRRTRLPGRTGEADPRQ